MVVPSRAFNQGVTAQPFQASVEVVPDVSQRLFQPLADLSQAHALKVIELERLTLGVTQIVKCRLQAAQIEFRSNLIFDVFP